MDLHRLDIFCHVYEEKSFSKGARCLDLSQPTVSIHVKALEESLGVQLFNRLGREIEATEAADYLYQHGRPLLEDMRVLLERMSGYLDRLEGDLEVGASTIPGEYLVPSWLRSFHEQHPGVRGRVFIRDSREIVDAVLDGRVQLGFVGARMDGETLDYDEVASDRLVLAVPADSPWAKRDEVSLEELEKAPWILREEGSGTRLRFERLVEEEGLHLGDFRVVLELGSTSAVKEAIKEGLGLSLVSDLAIRSELRGGLVQTVPLAGTQDVTRRFFVVNDQRRVLSPVARAFLQHVESVHRKE